MRSSAAPQITQLLIDWSNGDESALNQLMPLVYDELRRMARRYMRHERTRRTLQTTALVHEAYLRLADYKKIKWHEQSHFFAVAATVMRRILVEHARARGRLRRGGNAVTISLEAKTLTLADASHSSPNNLVDMIAFDEAMNRLEEFEVRKVKVVEMRLFAGMERGEIAEVLGVHPNTVDRDWSFAEAFLRRELSV